VLCSDDNLSVGKDSSTTLTLRTCACAIVEMAYTEWAFQIACIFWLAHIACGSSDSGIDARDVPGRTLRFRVGMGKSLVRW
jgi:hypothetical protein